MKSSKLCVFCQQVSVSEPHAVLKIYICSYCERQKSYSTSNTVRKGKACQWPAFSIEFEVAGEPERSQRALVLLQYQFERTFDATVSDEYKSPIYQNLRTFRRPLRVLDSLRDLVDARCGTHLHVTCEQKHALYQDRDAIFGPLIAHLSRQEEQTIAFWGRTFCEQARALLLPGERHVSFNTYSRYDTLEYRLPRFRNSAQYLAVVQFCRDTTAFLERSLLVDDIPKHGHQQRTPEQLGEQVLIRYKRAWKAFEAREYVQATFPLTRKQEWNV